MTHMPSRNIMGIFLILLFLIGLRCSGTAAQLVPAIFVFGDSLVDVGNNNHLHLSLAKADFPHNGVDFPGKRATGRFSNGKNAADFLAEKVGLPTSPPYLSLVSGNSNVPSFLTGVSFASGGAGIFDSTDQVYKQSIPLSKQVEYYTTVHDDLVKHLGSSAAHKLISKSLFAVVIGSNDVFGYSGSVKASSNPQQYVDSMTSSLKGYLNILHSRGARKFVIIGLGPIGCCPSQRNQNRTEECNEGTNRLSLMYNEALVAMLHTLKSEELGDISYSFYDTYTVMQSFIQSPASNGFTEVKAACCGLGKLKAKVACLPISKYCPNRRDHLFWDLYHPTEAAARLFIDDAFDGPSHHAFPVNVRQLTAL
ncbi:hypothetical protein SAY87_004104 [Trapa incisa]|uniref:GDSL esterase/lipase n=1 Tax=Trapa incisa TaxID=236973 RepID=A0AAN7JP28_9MYRT|nr:hypothetical protein SAY87_004104 [Trapa incisa]